MNRVERALLRIVTDLQQIGARFALIGGLAVSVRAEPRTTRDVDLAIAVGSDREADEMVRRLLDRGYRVEQHLEQTRLGRVATLRLLTPESGRRGVLIDLLFSFSGIEEEVVEAADLVEVLPGLSMPVARSSELLALKVLAGRPHDLEDARALLADMDPAELAVSRQLLDLISRRGFTEGRDLQAALERLLHETSEENGDE